MKTIEANIPTNAAHDLKRLEAGLASAVVGFPTPKEQGSLIPSGDEAFHNSAIARYEAEGGKTLPDTGA